MSYLLSGSPRVSIFRSCLVGSQLTAVSNVLFGEPVLVPLLPQPGLTRVPAQPFCLSPSDGSDAGGAGGHSSWA